MDGTTPTFAPQQLAAITAAADWLKRRTKEQQIFRLFGYAGTGKTTLAKHLAEGLNNVVYAAFTGKAALMMRRNGCFGASTIHSLIYQPIEQPDGSINFILDPESPVASADLVVIDECSMVDADLARDLMSFRKPILVLGDPAQLPPVKSAGFLTEAAPDAMLTEIHRQAEGNPIIQMAAAVREGRPLRHGVYGESRIVPRGELTEADIIAADQVLVGKNDTRRAFNARIRRALGRSSQMPEVEDRLVCLRNDKSHGIFNGGIFTVTEAPVRRSQKNMVRLKIRSEDFTGAAAITVQVRREFFFGGVEDLEWKELRHTQHFDFGYALTTHKAQGSQWSNVIAYDESGIFREDARRWLYTAITRATERLTLVM